MSSDADPPAVALSDVTRRFGQVEVLRGITLDLDRGQTTCILGGSGGGKSTLLRVMIGALPPSSGRVEVGGTDITDLKGRALDPVRARFGVMFQSGALLNSLTVAENVALPLTHRTRQDPETIELMVKIKLQQVGLLDAADRRPSQISGGMQKRAAVARALALDPQILFYDEPSAGLDPIATAQIDDLINQLKNSMGITNIVVTHVLESVRRIADRVVMLHRGTIRFDGTIEELERSPDPLVRQFVAGEMPAEETHVQSLRNYHRDLLA